MHDEKINSDVKRMSNRHIRSFVRQNGKIRFLEVISYIEEECPKEWICGEYGLTEAQYHSFCQYVLQPSGQAFKAQTN